MTLSMLSLNVDMTFGIPTCTLYLETIMSHVPIELCLMTETSLIFFQFTTANSMLQTAVVCLFSVMHVPVSMNG